MAVFDLHGLRVRSPVVLSGAGIAHGDEADIEVALGPPRPAPYRRPTADVVAELIVEGRPRYSFCRTRHGIHGRVYGLADFEFSTDLRTVTAYPEVGVAREIVAILIAGTVAAFVLSMRGRPVLHASGVAAGDLAVGFVGPSGCGKTTIAALCCTAGAAVLTDDLLPLRVDDGHVRCDTGTAELRLRPSAASLIERLPAGASRRTTADARLAVRPAAQAELPVTLSALVVPHPRRDGSPVAMRRLPAAEAALAVARFSRIEGWRDRDQLARAFHAASDIAERLPVLAMDVPWGPPFPDALGGDVLAALGAETADR